MTAGEFFNTLLVMDFKKFFRSNKMFMMLKGTFIEDIGKRAFQGLPDWPAIEWMEYPIAQDNN